MGHQYTLTAVSAAAVTDWRQHAACRGADPELFFPPPLGANLAPLMRRIRALCDPCPVREQCLRFALDAEGDARRENRHGIFAATTPRQRWAMWRCNTGRCQHPQHRTPDSPDPIPERAPNSGWPRARRPCTVPGCTRLARARRMCTTHYRAWMLASGQLRHGSQFGYDCGCRCDECRDRNRRTLAARKKRAQREVES